MVNIALRLLGFVFACSSVLAATDFDQDIVLAPHDGTAAEDIDIRRWQQSARTADAFERLGWAYVAKARRTLDAGFYTLAGKAAEVADMRFGARLALAEGTNVTRLFLHAGEISLARGERAVAEKHFAGAFVAAATLTPSERTLLKRRISTSTDVAAK